MEKESLIIDGNAVYEMDMDCHLKRMKAEKPEKKENREPVRPSRTRISIRNVDE